MKLTLWLNAFIPGTVAGYTQVLRAGPHAGKTAVPLPRIARLNPLNLIKNLDAGYLTDQRGFDTDKGAAVRMRSLIRLDLAQGLKVIDAEHVSSGTTEVDMDSGRQLGFGKADMSDCAFGKPALQTATATSGKRYRSFPLGLPLALSYPTASSVESYVIGLKAGAADPLVSAAADIDYEGVFEITILSRAPYRVVVRFDGRIDAFPAYECYAELNGRIKALFTSSPPPGNTVTDLLGDPHRAISGVAAFP
jgi:hypothetical protein